MLAWQNAEAAAQHVKDEAHAEVVSVRKDLTEAINEISRLEAVEAEQKDTLAQLTGQLEKAKVDIHEQAFQIHDLKQRLDELRGEVDQARQTASDKAIEASRLAGENATLRAQLSELIVAIGSRS